MQQVLPSEQGAENLHRAPDPSNDSSLTFVSLRCNT
jgi:hypothetical protein